MDKKKKGSAKAKAAKNPVIIPLEPEVPQREKDLMAKVEKLQKENNDLKEKLGILVGALMVAADSKAVINPNTTALVDISVESMLTLLSDLCATNRALQEKVNRKDSHVEDLEIRVTQLNAELAKLFRLKINMENGLESIENCSDLNSAKVRAKILWYEACGTNIYVNMSDGSSTISRSDEEQNNCNTSSQVNGHSLPSPSIPEPVSRPLSALSRAVPYPPHTTLSAQSYAPASTVASSLNTNSVLIHSTKAHVKLPGDTHIKDLLPHLKELFIQELSLQKSNGNDWRILAQRMGIPDALVDQWIAMCIPQPMKNVFRVWGESPGATVRLLHRHLMSPQLRCLTLAKHLSSMYSVD